LAGFERSGEVYQPKQAELRRVAAQRLAGVALGLRITDGAGTTAAVDSLRVASFAAAARTVQILDASLPAVLELQAAGVAYAVVKGPGLSRISGGLGQRPFTDLDIVVKPAQLDVARRLLERHGYSGEGPLGWPSMERVCGEAVNLRHDEGGAIDLHQRIPPWLWTRRLDAERIIEQSVPHEVGGRRIAVACDVHNLLISALHIVSDKNRPGANLMAWRDVLASARVCPPEAVASEAARAGLDGWLLWILDQLPKTVRPHELVDALTVRRRPRVAAPRRLRYLLAPSEKAPLAHVALRLPAWRGTLFLAGMAVPSRAFVRAKSPEARHPYFAWWSKTRRTVRA
jgi:hypothetical protein